MNNARSPRDSIRSMLADLKMPGALEATDQILSEVDGASSPPPKLSNVCSALRSCYATIAGFRRQCVLPACLQ
ncbi:hypothetical protein DFLDMN_005568 [Cupriavidus sp. H19C3]